MEKAVEIVLGYHVHVYFDESTANVADRICTLAHEKYGVVKGRMHHQPVGPHPAPSCQLSATPEQFTALLPWITLNREGLTVFIHPETGDALADHRDHAVWIGESLPLHLDIFA